MLLQARVAGALAVALLATGCSTTFRAAPLNPEGRFPTTTKLSVDAVKTNEPFEEKFRPLAYVKFDQQTNSQYQDFVIASLRNTKAFTRVVTKAELESMVIEKALTDKVSNVSDLIGLNHLQKEIGPFLVVEINLEWKGGYDFLGTLKSIDPSNGKTMLLLEQQAFNFSGLDGPLFYPLFNGFLEWTQGKPITVGTPAASAPAKKKKAL
jgi:hypothetical protein